MLVIAKSADYAIRGVDSNAVFTNRGATALVTLTLPALAKSLRFRFFTEAAFPITVAAAPGEKMVTAGNPETDSITFGTTVGSILEVMANDNSTRWMVVGPQASAPETPVTAAKTTEHVPEVKHKYR